MIGNGNCHCEQKFANSQKISSNSYLDRHIQTYFHRAWRFQIDVSSWPGKTCPAMQIFFSKWLQTCKCLSRVKSVPQGENYRFIGSPPCKIMQFSIIWLLCLHVFTYKINMFIYMCGNFALRVLINMWDKFLAGAGVKGKDAISW